MMRCGYCQIPERLAGQLIDDATGDVVGLVDAATLPKVFDFVIVTSVETRVVLVIFWVTVTAEPVVDESGACS